MKSIEWVCPGNSNASLKYCLSWMNDSSWSDLTWPSNADSHWSPTGGISPLSARLQKGCNETYISWTAQKHLRKTQMLWENHSRCTRIGTQFSKTSTPHWDACQKGTIVSKTSRVWHVQSYTYFLQIGLVSTSDCYAGGLPIESGILPLLKHACREAISCHVGRQEVGRCHTRGKFQGMYITYTSTKCE